uniref:SH3 domain-containing protein n=1 Tax=Hemiselmis andersenii TaxID=464988 RepID=A0A6U2CDS9_HEMAN|mmetsp:Transcript_20394/g.47103  ORF Transcript_20394/g.47103 Transcript_20394/m.47103 type:complete len:258 (+) Transcript_20394:198-971(+)
MAPQAKKQGMTPLENLLDGFNALMCGNIDKKQPPELEGDDMALLYSPPTSPKGKAAGGDPFSEEGLGTRKQAASKDGSMKTYESAVNSSHADGAGATQAYGASSREDDDWDAEPPPKRVMRQKGVRIAIATHKFDPQDEDGLPLKKNQRIAVLREDEDDEGWAFCEDSNGARGVAPENRMKLLPEGPPNFSVFRAKFKFQQTNVDELSVRKGEIFFALESTEDPGWLMCVNMVGANNDRVTGLVPKAYTEVLDPDAF